MNALRFESSQQMAEGDGARVRRLFPLPNGRRNFDPFVLFDDFSIEPGSGFPTHPHRGFEAITWLFSGSVEHRDNLGNCSILTPGGAQRFTAGSGIAHSEMPASSGKTEGIQLWINLPQRLKKLPPNYQQCEAAEFPVHKFVGGETTTIVGAGGPVQLQSSVTYQQVRLEAGGSFCLDLSAGWVGLIYLRDGEVQADGRNMQAGECCLIDAIDAPATVTITASLPSLLMALTGCPHGEPIRQYGPFVD